MNQDVRLATSIFIVLFFSTFPNFLNSYSVSEFDKPLLTPNYLLLSKRFQSPGSPPKKRNPDQLSFEMEVDLDPNPGNDPEKGLSGVFSISNRNMMMLRRRAMNQKKRMKNTSSILRYVNADVKNSNLKRGNKNGGHRSPKIGKGKNLRHFMNNLDPSHRLWYAPKMYDFGR